VDEDTPALLLFLVSAAILGPSPVILSGIESFSSPFF